MFQTTVRTTIITTLFALLALCVPVLASGPPQAPAEGPLPPLKLLPAEFDAGYIGVEDLIEAEFKVFNPTRETMVIDGFTTSCKCTAPIIEDRVIPPGKYVTVRATVDLRGHLGDVHKAFTLMIRGYDRQLPCSIRAVMGTKIRVEPKRVDRIMGQLRLTSMDGVPFTPLALHNQDSTSTFTPVNPDEDGKSTVWQMDYRLPPRSADTCLLIETDHPETPLLTPRLYTAAASRPEIEFIKQRLEIFSVRTHALMSELPAGDSIEIECQIRRAKGKEHTPLSVRTDLDGLDAEIISVDAIEGEANPDFVTQVYTVEVTNNGVRQDAIMTPMTFKTPDGFECRIWLLGLARKVGETLEPETTTTEAAPGE